MFIMSLIQIVEGRGKDVVSNIPPSPPTYVDLEETQTPNICDQPPPPNEV